MVFPHGLAAFVTNVSVSNVGELSAESAPAQPERRFIDFAMVFASAVSFVSHLFSFIRHTTKGMSYLRCINAEAGCTFLPDSYTDVQA